MLQLRHTIINSYTVSEGTLRPYDLANAFFGEAKTIAPEITRDWLAVPQGRFHPDAWDDEAHPWWEMQEAADVIDELTTILDEAAGPGTRFGSLEGDGACFGFWPVEPDDDDYRIEQDCDRWIIRDWRGNELFNARSENQACLWIKRQCEKGGFWPDVWLDGALVRIENVLNCNPYTVVIDDPQDGGTVFHVTAPASELHTGYLAIQAALDIATIHEGHPPGEDDDHDYYTNAVLEGFCIEV